MLAGSTIKLSEIDVLVLAGEELLEDLRRHVVEGSAPALVVLSSNTIRLPAILNTLSPQGWGIVQPDASTAQLQVAALAAAQGLRVIPNLYDAQPNSQVLPQSKHVLERDVHQWNEGQALNRSSNSYIPADFELDNIDVDLPEEVLTVREREVLELLSQGLPNKLIARRLHISEHTVKFHVSSIYAKLGASSRTDAVSRGVRRGFITL